MRYILSLLIFIFSFSLFAQQINVTGRKYYVFNPLVGVALVNEDSTILPAGKSKVKSDKYDNNATEFIPKGWVVWQGINDTNLVSNGTFENSTGWSLQTNWEISGGKLTRISSGLPNSEASISDTFPTTDNNTYFFKFDISNNVNGSVYIYFGNVQEYFSGNGTVYGSFTRTNFVNNPILRLGTYDGFVGSIDNLEIRKVMSSDSTYTSKKILYDLQEDTDFTYYSSLFQRNVNGDTVYKKSKNKRLTIPIGYWSNGIYLEDGHRLTFEDGSIPIFPYEAPCIDSIEIGYDYVLDFENDSLVGTRGFSFDGDGGIGGFNSVEDTSALNGSNFGFSSTVSDPVENDYMYGRLDLSARDSIYVRFYFTGMEGAKLGNTTGVPIFSLNGANNILNSNIYLGATSTGIEINKISANITVSIKPTVWDISDTTCIEVFYKKGTGSDAVHKIWVNGELMYNVTNGTQTVQVTDIRLGFVSSVTNRLSQPTYFKFDNIIISDSPIGLYNPNNCN